MVVLGKEIVTSSLGETVARALGPRIHHTGTETKALMPNLGEVRAARELPDLRALPDLCEDNEPPIRIIPWDVNQIHNIGVDVRLGHEVWITDTLMRINNPDDLELLKSAKKQRINESFVCEPDPHGRNVYYFLTHEKIKTAPYIEYKVDSKSTTGRVGCMSHQVSNGDLFDGRIMIALQPYAFPIEVIPGRTSTSQVIFRYRGTPLMSPDEIKKAWKHELALLIEDALVDLNAALKPGGLEMTFSTKRAFKAKKTREPIDLTKRDYYDPKDFFDETEGDGRLLLEPNGFYLLGTREAIRLGNICGELTRENANVGTGLWSHFAGFFMPGYNGEITLECLTPIRRCISSGDPAGLVLLDRVDTTKSIKFEGKYQNQRAPMLPKVFKSNP